jgi:hypothetical protein
MEAKSLVRAAFAIVCLTATALGLSNTYGDNAEVKALAQRTACGAPNCSISDLSQARSAFSQRFGFQTALVQKGKSAQGASVDVECKRKLIFVGDYECAVTSGGLPGVIGSAAPP